MEQLDPQGQVTVQQVDEMLQNAMEQQRVEIERRMLEMKDFFMSFMNNAEKETPFVESNSRKEKVGESSNKDERKVMFKAFKETQPKGLVPYLSRNPHSQSNNGKEKVGESSNKDEGNVMFKAFKETQLKGMASRKRPRVAADHPPPPQPLGADPAAAPAADIHPWLRFEDPTHIQRFQVLAHRAICPLYTVSWTAMDTIGLAQPLRDVLDHGPRDVAHPPAFSRLLDIDEPVYHELTLEFLSTITFMERYTDYNKDGMLKFRLGGEQFSMSLRTFAQVMGIYTKAEAEHPSFDEAVRGPADGFVAEAFWATIAEGRYDAHVAKATAFKDPLLRILHRVISCSIASRGSLGGVSKRDLMMMSRFLDPTCVIQIAYWLAFLLREPKGLRETSPLLGGMYITRLARQLGVLDAKGVEDALTVVQDAARVSIGMEMLRSMRMVDEHGHLIGAEEVEGGVEGEGIQDEEAPRNEIPTPHPSSRLSPATQGPSTSSAPGHILHIDASDPFRQGIALELLEFRRILAHLVQHSPAPFVMAPPHFIVDPLPTPPVPTTTARPPSPHPDPSPTPNPT